jgi:glycosyltransferase involved in cell wall biosynthesis
VIEAGSHGLPVVASNLQGLKDAIIDKETGYLVEERNAQEFLDRIRSMDLRKNDIRRCVINHFHWSEIYKQYRIALMEL